MMDQMDQMQIMDSKISKANQEQLQKEDIDIKAMNLLVDYVSRLYAMITKNKKVQNLDMSPEEI